MKFSEYFATANKKVLAYALSILLVSSAVYAATVVIWPANYMKGQIISSADMSARFNDLDARISRLQGSMVDQVAAFPGTCPAGWTAYTEANGRTIVGTFIANGNETKQGEALSADKDLGRRMITEVPAHTHMVDPLPKQTSGVETTPGVPDYASMGWEDAVGGTSPGFLWSKVLNESYGFHNHQHWIDIPATKSEINAGAVASVDVTMPYIQMTFCRFTGNFTP